MLKKQVKSQKSGVRRIAAFCLLFPVSCLLSSAFAAPTFDRDIKPIFERRCSSCHGEEKTKGGLSLATFAEVMKGGDDGAVIVPGKSDESLLVKLIEHRMKPHMPPKSEGEPLSADEIKLIRAWIDAGALADSKAPADSKPQPVVAKPQAPVETAKSPTSQPAGKMPPQIGSVAFSPDGKTLAVGSLHVVELLNRADGHVVQRLEGHAENVRALAFNKDGALLAAGGGQPAASGEVKIWKVADAKVMTTIQGHQDCIYAVAFSPDGKLLATASYDKMVYLWDVSTGKEVHAFKNHVDAVYDVAFTVNGKRLATVSADRSVKIWDVESGKHLYNLSESQGPLYSVAVHPNGQQVAAAGADKMIRVWTMGDDGGKLVQSWFAHDKPILKIAYSPDGKQLYSTGQDRLLKTWDAQALSELHVFEEQPDWDLTLAASLDGSALAVGRFDGSLVMYDLASGKAVLNRVPQSLPKKKPAVQVVQGVRELIPAVLATQPANAPKNNKVGDFIPVDVTGGAVTIPPGLNFVDFKGAPLGSTLVVTLNGQNLDGATEVTTGDAGVRAKIVSIKDFPKPKLQRVKFNTAAEIADGTVTYEMKVELAIGYEARPGMHELLVRTPRGVSNSVAFYVEDLLEVAEREPNDEPATAQAITRSIVVLGAMNKVGDVDHYHINAQAGQTFAFDVVGSALGSPLNGVMTLAKADGTTVARSDDFGKGVDPRLVYKFSEAGAYDLSLTDREMDAGGFYRLRVEARAALTDVFPLGVQKGKTVDIAVEGIGLAAKTVKVTGIMTPAWGQTIGVPVTGKNGDVVTRLALAVGEDPEMIESEPNDDVAKPQAVTAPVTINGRIDHQLPNGAGDVDVYKFSAKKGQRLILDVMAQRIGSSLDSYIEVLDAGGKRIERATLRAVAKTFVVLVDRDSRAAGIRMDNWDDFRVNDFVMIGSEVIRVLRIPNYGDEDTLYINARGQRTGYLDTTPEFHAVNTNLYKVEIHPPGTTFAPNGMPIFHVYTQNDDGGAPNYGKDSRITFDPPADGDYLVRIRSATSDSDRRYTYRLAIRPPRPDFNVFAGPGDINVIAGSNALVTATVSRMDDFDGPIHVKLLDLPAGFTANESDVLPEQESTMIVLTAGPGAKSTLPDGKIRVVALGKINGTEITRESRLRMLTVVDVKPDVEVLLEPPVVNFPAGGTGEITVHVKRNNGFAGRVQIEPLDLPFGVEVANRGLNGILVIEAEQSRTFRLFSQPWQPAMNRQITVTGDPASTARQKYVYAAPPIVLHMTRPEKAPQIVRSVAGP